MGKKFAMIRVGLLDHLDSTLARCPDASHLYFRSHVRAPLSGPDEGCVYINQTDFAERWRWTRKRVNAAVRFLVEHGYLVCIERGSRHRPAKFYIRNFKGDEPGLLCSESTLDDTLERPRDSSTVPQVCSEGTSNASTVPQVCSEGTVEDNRNARAQELLESLRTREGGDAGMKSEKTHPKTGETWIVVDTEAEAVQALLDDRGFKLLPEEIQDSALRIGLENLKPYRIAYRPPESPADGSHGAGSVEAPQGSEKPTSEPVGGSRADAMKAWQKGSKR